MRTLTLFIMWIGTLGFILGCDIHSTYEVEPDYLTIGDSLIVSGPNISRVSLDESLQSSTYVFEDDQFGLASDLRYKRLQINYLSSTQLVVKTVKLGETRLVRKTFEQTEFGNRYKTFIQYIIIKQK